MKTGHYTIKDYTEETCCEYCGCPLYPGRKVYYDINDDAGAVFCSKHCADRYESFMTGRSIKNVQAQLVLLDN